MVNPEDLTIREFQEWRNHAIGMQRSVLTIFAMWLEDHRLLDEEPHIAQRMTKFLHLIVMPPLSTQAKLLIQTVERLVRCLVIYMIRSALHTFCRRLQLRRMPLPKTLHADVRNYILTRMIYSNSAPPTLQNNCRFLNSNFMPKSLPKSVFDMQTHPAHGTIAIYLCFVAHTINLLPGSRLVFSITTRWGRGLTLLTSGSRLRR